METENKNDQQMKNVSSAGAGLHPVCKINNIQTQCLIDTGATFCSTLLLKDLVSDFIFDNHIFWDVGNYKTV